MPEPRGAAVDSPGNAAYVTPHPPLQEALMIRVSVMYPSGKEDITTQMQISEIIHS